MYESGEHQCSILVSRFETDRSITPLRRSKWKISNAQCDCTVYWLFHRSLRSLHFLRKIKYILEFRYILAELINFCKRQSFWLINDNIFMKMMDYNWTVCLSREYIFIVPWHDMMTVIYLIYFKYHNQFLQLF